MSEPKVQYTLRQVIYDAQIALAETDNLMAAEDIDDMTGYASTTEASGAVLTNAGGGGTTGLVAVAGRIEHPRNIVLTQVVDGCTGGNVRVIGIGMDGQPTNELLSLLSASGTVTGNVPFLRVDEVHVWGVTGTLSTTDTLAIGMGAKIGLPRGSDETLYDVVKERFNSADIAVTTANINRTYGTYTPTSTLDGAKVLEVWYVTKRVLTY
jgi:hypothetical protein